MNSMTDNPPAPGAFRPGLRYVALFALGYVAFYALYQLVPNQYLAEVIYRWGINEPAAVIINALSPGAAARAAGHLLVSPKAQLEIVRGCDGSGLLFIIAAAILAFPTTIGRRLVGVAASFIVVFVLNELRVVVLYFVVAYRPTWFTLLHAYLFPLLLIAIICVLFMWWTRMVLPGRRLPGDA